MCWNLIPIERVENAGEGMVLHTCNLKTLGRPRQEDHQFEYSLGYLVSLRPIWATPWYLVSKKGMWWWWWWWWFNLAMMFRGGAFRRWLGLDSINMMEPPWLNPGGLTRKGKETILFSFAVWYKILSARRPSPDVGPGSWTSRTVSQNRHLFFITHPASGISF
jgi:hypothetical protein